MRDRCFYLFIKKNPFQPMLFNVWNWQFILFHQFHSRIERKYNLKQKETKWPNIYVYIYVVVLHISHEYQTVGHWVIYYLCFGA